MVGDGQRRHAQFPGPGHHFRNLSRAVEQRKLGMGVQMHKGILFFSWLLVIQNLSHISLFLATRLRGRTGKSRLVLLFYHHSRPRGKPSDFSPKSSRHDSSWKVSPAFPPPTADPDLSLRMPELEVCILGLKSSCTRTNLDSQMYLLSAQHGKI